MTPPEQHLLSAVFEERLRDLRPIRPPVDRFWEHVVRADGCWEWTGNHLPTGYSHFSVRGTLVYAHRFSYELVHGPIPAGLQIDHLCRNRGCVNPDHLEAVTPLVNTRRGERSQRTHCPHGHAYPMPVTTYRYCLPCHARREASRRARLKAEGRWDYRLNRLKVAS